MIPIDQEGCCVDEKLTNEKPKLAFEMFEHMKRLVERGNLNLTNEDIVMSVYLGANIFYKKDVTTTKEGESQYQIVEHQQTSSV